MKAKNIGPMTLDDLAENVYKELLTVGVSSEVAKAFVCFRFHPQCAWGLGRVRVNDMETFAIVRPLEDDRTKVEAVFVATKEGMTGLSELQGIEQLPDKSQLN
jgi:hypothetical protein